MGDRGGKKQKAKSRRQEIVKRKDKAKEKKAKEPAPKPETK